MNALDKYSSNIPIPQFEYGVKRWKALLLLAGCIVFCYASIHMAIKENIRLSVFGLITLEGMWVTAFFLLGAGFCLLGCGISILMLIQSFQPPRFVRLETEYLVLPKRIKGYWQIAWKDIKEIALQELSGQKYIRIIYGNNKKAHIQQSTLLNDKIEVVVSAIFQVWEKYERKNMNTNL